MKNLLKTSTIIGIVLALTNCEPVMATNFNHINELKQDSLSSNQFLKQLFLSSNQALLSAKLSINHSNDNRLKSIAKEIVGNQISMNESIRILAKKNKVDLPMSMPEGGQRPDGRIDSAPENLKDTTRIQNAVGEAMVPAGKVKDLNTIDEVTINQRVSKLKNLNPAVFNRTYREEAIANLQFIITTLGEGTTSNSLEIKRFSKKYFSVSKQLLKKLESMKSE